nr:DUF2147 domain-containing protein [uncultured Cohaesibacter sp.]
MTKLILVATALLALNLPSAFANPVFGEWKTQGSEISKYSGHYLHVRFAPCQKKICGHITKVVGINANIVGKPIIWNMKAKRAGYYSGGTIWAPDRGGTYASKMKLTGNKLKVSGCIAGSLLCKSQIWTRLQ